MKAQWTQPQGLRLTERLREVAAKLVEATPHLVQAQAKAFEAMVETIQLTDQARDGSEAHG